MNAPLEPIPLVTAPNREAWLDRAVGRLSERFARHGYSVPAVRVGVGWPSTGDNKHVGQCWPRHASGGGLNEIFISPVEADPVEVLDTLMHELVHAVDDCEHRHGKAFRAIALKVGLQGPMRQAGAGPELQAWLRELAHELGPYPHHTLTVEKHPRPARRGGKAECPEPGCDYRLAIRRKLLRHGAPWCPVHGVEMTLTLPEDYREDEDEEAEE